MAFVQVRAKVVRDDRVDAVHAALESVNIVNAGEVLRGDLHSEHKKQCQDMEEGLWHHGRGDQRPAAAKPGLYKYTHLSTVTQP